MKISSRNCHLKNKEIISQLIIHNHKVQSLELNKDISISKCYNQDFNLNTGQSLPQKIQVCETGIKTKYQDHEGTYQLLLFLDMIHSIHCCFIFKNILTFFLNCTGKLIWSYLKSVLMYVFMKKQGKKK